MDEAGGDTGAGLARNTAEWMMQEGIPVPVQREITPKAFANFSPGLERSDNPGSTKK